MDLDGIKDFASKYVVLPLGINASAGAVAGVLLKASNPMVTLVSGAISGALQSVATKPRNWVLATLDTKLEGVAKIAALAIAFFAIYSIHVPVLMATSTLLFGSAMDFVTALGLTAVGGGIGMVEYLAAQDQVDRAKEGQPVKLF